VLGISFIIFTQQSIFVNLSTVNIVYPKLFNTVAIVALILHILVFQCSTTPFHFQ